MKKLLGFAIFTALMIWTWGLIHSTSPVTFETHAGIQEKLSTLIQTIIQSKIPNATDVNVSKMITENLSNNQVKAIFSYSYTEPQENGEVSEQIIDGEAVLAREASENPDDDKWVLQSVKTTGDSITFVEGTVIGPESEVPAEEQQAPSTTE